MSSEVKQKPAGSASAQMAAELDAIDPMWVGLTDDVASGWYRQNGNELFRDFCIEPDDVVLDVGCGSGGGSARFCGQRGAHVICVDIDAEKVAEARKILEQTSARRVETYVSDANPLPLLTETASKIICMEVIEHVDDPTQFLAELVRVGKPGARYLITVPDALQENLQKQLAPTSYFEKPNHIRIIERAEFAAMVSAAGLEIEQQEHHGFYSAFQWIIFWACGQKFMPPWHCLLKHWARTWGMLLAMDDGMRSKHALDEFMPKLQVIVAHKPLHLKSPALSVKPILQTGREARRVNRPAIVDTAFKSMRKLGTSVMRRVTGWRDRDLESDETSTVADTRLSGWFCEESQELLQGFKVTAADIVLDIGCGDAPFIHFCARQGAEVVFADIDPDKVAAVERALQGSPARAMRPLVTDGNPLQLPDASMTKVVAMEVLEHVDDPAQFMEELVRVGKPGAQYLITVPDALSEELQRSLAPESYFQRPNHVRIFQRDEFERLIVNAGLIIERRTYYGFFWSIWWCLFWVCRQDLGAPWHPLLDSWGKTWACLLRQPEGPKIKSVLDNFMPKSQAIIARKP